VSLETFGFPEGRSKKTYLDGTKFRKATGLQFTSMSDVMKEFTVNING